MEATNGNTIFSGTDSNRAYMTDISTGHVSGHITSSYLIEQQRENFEKQPLKFKDAVGRKFSVPFNMAKTWQVSLVIVPAFCT
jgi:hypothetical protein